MSCGIHPNREHVGVCCDCGQQLCSECTNKFNPPSCPNCMLAWGQKIKKDLILKSVISVVVFALWLIYGISLMANGFSILIGCLMFAGIPWGWNALTKITPKMFLFLPLVGWGIYFGIKLLISLFIGLFCAPFQIIKILKGIKLAETARIISE